MEYSYYIDYIKNFSVREFFIEEQKLCNNKKNANDAEIFLINQKIIILRQLFNEKYYYLYF